MHNIDRNYVKDLDLNLLRVFAIVAEEGSITRAADRLYITQPSVSAAMSRLRAFLGTELFARQGRGIVLTSRGTELLRAVRAYLTPLVSATMVAPSFDPKASTALIRLGLADAMESLILPKLLARFRSDAPQMRLIVLPVQFRTVESALLTEKVDLAVSVADELPRSILRQPLRLGSHQGFVCLYDSRHHKLPRKLTERQYLASEHVAVSYAGDMRGIIEDSLGKSRNVRLSVPAFSYVAEVVDGSPLLATVPALYAEHLMKTRRHFKTARLPFAPESASLDLLWSRVTDDDPVNRFVRGLLSLVTRP